MDKFRIVGGLFSMLVLIFSANGQGNRGRVSTIAAQNAAPCTLSGAYQIDITGSDKLYSVVREATGGVPLGDEQRFFTDLSLRLTPPDLLAIECRGKEVSVGSSRAPKASYLADGKTHQEQTPSGGTVYSRVTLNRDTLTFVSDGKPADSIRVAFTSLDGGRRLRVTRSIYAEQLAKPIVINSVYDRIADTVDWGGYRGSEAVRGTPDNVESVPDKPAARRSKPASYAGDEATALRHSLDEWIAATNRRDIEGQMDFYMPNLQAFYLARNAPSQAVRLEKTRVFRAARSVNVSAEEPEIVFQDGGRTAVMRFRKRYRIAESARTRSGEVIQELRWRKTPDGWRIFSERDVRVIR